MRTPGSVGSGGLSLTARFITACRVRSCSLSSTTSAPKSPQACSRSHEADPATHSLRGAHPERKRLWERTCCGSTTSRIPTLVEIDAISRSAKRIAPPGRIPNQLAIADAPSFRVFWRKGGNREPRHLTRAAKRQVGAATTRSPPQNFSTASFTFLVTPNLDPRNQTPTMEACASHRKSSGDLVQLEGHGLGDQTKPAKCLFWYLIDLAHVCNFWAQSVRRKGARVYFSMDCYPLLLLGFGGSKDRQPLQSSALIPSCGFWQNYHSYSPLAVDRSNLGYCIPLRSLCPVRLHPLLRSGRRIPFLHKN